MTDFSPEFPEIEALKGKDPKMLGALTLAYVGDTVYELLNRLLTVSHGDRPVEKLHAETISRSKAVTQSRIVEVLETEFTEEELQVYKRGRNANVHTKAKNATAGEYHRATGFEAVIGYLYLLGRKDRIKALLKKGFDGLNT